MGHQGSQPQIRAPRSGQRRCHVCRHRRHQWQHAEGRAAFRRRRLTHSIIMRSKTGTVRIIEATHNFNRKPAGLFWAAPGMDSRPRGRASDSLGRPRWSGSRNAALRACRRWHWPSSRLAARLSAGCWRRAASAKDDCERFLRRPCATLPDPCALRGYGSRRWSASSGDPRRRDDRDLRRLRCRRRDLIGAAEAIFCAVGADALIYCPTAARRLRPERDGAAASSRHRARASSSPSIAASWRTSRCATAAAGSTYRRRPSSRPSRAAASLAVIDPNRLDETARRASWPPSASLPAVVAINRALRAGGWYANRPEPASCNGSISWRSAPSATSCR